MNGVIRPWEDLAVARRMRERASRPDLLLGNGASISLHPAFLYRSLRERAQADDAMGDAARVLEALDTADFELALRVTAQAQRVLAALGEPADRVAEAASAVRAALIHAVRASHPSDLQELNAGLQDRLRRAAGFVRGFRAVLNLNYDVALYRALMADPVADAARHTFDDGFRGDRLFHPRAIEERPDVTALFYPHGSLILGVDANGAETKLRSGGGRRLLDAILEQWTQGDVTPLFVCEGEARQKRAAIARSAYLSRISMRVLPGLRNDLVIYGWGLGEQDHHILEAIAEGGLADRCIAVSVYDGVNGLEQAHYCTQAARALRCLSRNPPEIEFFASSSPGCWCY